VDWIFKDRPLSSKPPKDSSYGFVYLLTLNDGTLYVGRKAFWSTTKKKFTQREIEAMTNKREKKWKHVVKESDWRKYTGSSKLFGSKDIVKREILCIAKSKRHLTYLENKELYSRAVLEDDKYRNDNISGKMFKGNLI